MPNHDTVIPMTNTPIKISFQADGGAIVTARSENEGWLITCQDCPDVSYELSKKKATRVAYHHAMSHRNEFRNEAIVSMAVSSTPTTNYPPTLSPGDTMNLTKYDMHKYESGIKAPDPTYDDLGPNVVGIAEYRTHLREIAPTLTEDQLHTICSMAINYAYNFSQGKM